MIRARRRCGLISRLLFHHLFSLIQCAEVVLLEDARCVSTECCCCCLLCCWLARSSRSTLVVFLPARRYASASTSCGPVSVRPSVRLCLSQSVFCRNWWTDQTGFLAWRLLSTSPTLYCKDIQVSRYTRVHVYCPPEQYFVLNS